MMSPKYFHLLFLFHFLVQVVLSARMEEEGYVYDSIRIRDEGPSHPRHVADPTPRKSKRPLNPNGGSRYLNRRRRPGRKQLNKSSLMVLMGDDYQTSWMSDERPKKPLISVPSNEVNLDEIPGRWSQERLTKQLNAINLTAELVSLQPDLLPFESMVREWIVKRSSCPVQFSWKDLGPTYWPRWIRKGECANRKGFCSYPTGMHCVPGATTNVMLLFWDCDEKRIRNARSNENIELKDFVQYRHRVPRMPLRKRNRLARSPGDSDSETSVLYKNRVPHIPPMNNIKKKKRCDWKKVPYPITVDCFCTC